MSLRDSIKEVSPPWLAAETGERLLYSCALILDAYAECMNQGVKARMPGEGTPTALPLIGADRLIIRGPNESDDSYADRLSQAFDTWRFAGTPQIILRQLLAYVTPNTPKVLTVTKTSIWDTVSSDVWSRYYAAANWNWDGTVAKWFEAWIVMFQTSFASEGTWGDGQLWGDGGTWGTTATVSDVATIRAIVALWKPKHEVIKNIIISFDAAKFDQTKAAGDASLPDGKFWREWKSSGGNAVPTRFVNAAYWDGTT